MEPNTILTIQALFSLIAFGLMARWYIAPRLAKLTMTDALIVLLWVHVFRFVPLTLLLPGQVDSSIPRGVLEAIAYGDLIAAVLALVAILMLRNNVRGAMDVVWVFTVAGVIDLVQALSKGVSVEIVTFDLGFNWYVLSVYVPMLIVTHVMMISYLLRRKRTE